MIPRLSPPHSFPVVGRPNFRLTLRTKPTVESSTSPLAADHPSSLTESHISSLLSQSDLTDVKIEDLSANVMPMVKWMAGLAWVPDHLIARPLSWISGSKDDSNGKEEKGNKEIGSGEEETMTNTTFAAGALWKMFKNGRAKYVVISATKKGTR